MAVACRDLPLTITSPSWRRGRCVSALQLLFLAAALSVCGGLGSRRSPFLGPHPAQPHRLLTNPHSHSRARSSSSPDITYKTLYVTQQVDHFGFANTDTFQQRYLVADQFWDKENGPIFFYTGNEGDITWFCNNTGLMWDWAPEFKAMLVFAEHRYYGESLPYGNDSFKDPDHYGFLTAEQALADFSVLIANLKRNTSGRADRPVVAFGGSYGGMLAAWLRMKYPHIVKGSLAGSAPILMFGDLVPCGAFYQTVTADFQRTGKFCADNIRKSWAAITDMGKTDSGRQSLSEMFSTCAPLTSDSDVNLLKSWLSEAYTNLAMVDYPYPANFLEPLPKWPVEAVCRPLNHASLSDSNLLKALSVAIKIYYNYTGSSSCLNIKQSATGNLGQTGWDIQSCGEMVMPICADGKQDMFEPVSWDLSQVIRDCEQNYGLTPRPDWILDQFGGKNLDAHSNIIFSNGDLDPWRVGGVLETVVPSLVAVRVLEGAHHLDLRSETSRDPPSLLAVREQEKATVRGWLAEASRQRKKEDLENKYQGFAGNIYDYDYPDEFSFSKAVIPLGQDTDSFVLIICVLLLVIGSFYFYMSHRANQLLSRYVSKQSPSHDLAGPEEKSARDPEVLDEKLSPGQLDEKLLL